MILGKRNADTALLPTIDIRPHKRTASTDDDDESFMSEASSSKVNSSWAPSSWLAQATSAISNLLGELYARWAPYELET